MDREAWRRQSRRVRRDGVTTLYFLSHTDASYLSLSNYFIFKWLRTTGISADYSPVHLHSLLTSTVIS